MIDLSRRELMKTGALALAAPAVLRTPNARAAGSLSVYSWDDYFDNNTILADFTNATGIEVALATYGSNEECESKLRAGGGKGFDVIFPSVGTGPNYYRDNLLRPIDEAKFRAAQVIPSIYRHSLQLGAADHGRRYLIPFDWGTEGLTWDYTKFDKASGDISFGDLWLAGADGRTAIHLDSIFDSTALYLDATGVLSSNRARDLYGSEADSRRVFEGCLAFLLAHKANIGATWNDGEEASAAFTKTGCTIGQTWDSTGMDLARETDAKWRYGMPKEGGLGWTDALAIPTGATHVEEAYAFINFLYQPEIAARFANTTGYNSCAVGAERYLSNEVSDAFSAAYPPGTIDKLFWRPKETETYVKLRSEYVGKLTNG